MVVSAHFLLFFIPTFLATLAGVRGVRHILRRHQVMDNPNERSNHTLPTPRGGGIAVVAALVTAWGGIASLEQGSITAMWPILAGGLALALISFLDDIRSISVRWRLLVQAASVVIGILFLYNNPHNGLISQGLLPTYIDMAIATILWLWWVNLYNFMDGIDGITGGESASIALGLIVLAFYTAIPDAPMVYYASALLAVSLGFLFWNWHPASIFMGDVGSVPLGYFTGFLLLSLAMHGYGIAALLLPAYYLGDSTYTLLKRFFQGKKIWEAHSEHCYQRAVRQGFSHAEVVSRIMTVNIALTTLAIMAAFLPEYSVHALILGYSLVAFRMAAFCYKPCAIHRPFAMFSLRGK
jgi:UDP-N-acetylmuramyl pentapeptide phosphotransferase/UDP-N-acetylglucosamine-1-phosphate transferase